MMYGFVCIESDRVLIDNPPPPPAAEFCVNPAGPTTGNGDFVHTSKHWEAFGCITTDQNKFPPSLLPLLFCILMTSSGTKKFGSNVTGVDETKAEGKKQ